MWRYVRQFFGNKQDRMDADLVRRYYKQLLQESTEKGDDLKGEAGFRQQEVYGRIQEAMSRKPRGLRPRMRTIQLAAAVLAAVSVAGWYWYTVQETTSVAVAMKTEHNALPNEIKKLTLPDGTGVWLNSGSTISYFADNTARMRTVRLQGEAYFDVMPDSKRPLVVHTDSINVQVLGTSFNVRAHTDEHDVEVFVTTGKVSVGEITLRPNQRVKYDKTNGRFTEIDSIDAHDKAMWVTGNMRYRATPLRVILADLERRFHIQVDVDSQLVDCLITVDFGKDKSEDALAILAGVLAGDVKYEQGIYKLTGKSCK